VASTTLVVGEGGVLFPRGVVGREEIATLSMWRQLSQQGPTRPDLNPILCSKLSEERSRESDKESLHIAELGGEDNIKLALILIIRVH
jgi:hypothetical protein